MTSQQLAKSKLPDTPGVYFFLGAPKRSGGGAFKGREILYIGKATSLHDRTRSYFAKDLIETRGPSILDMVFKASKIDWEEMCVLLKKTCQKSWLYEARKLTLIQKNLKKYN